MTLIYLNSLTQFQLLHSIIPQDCVIPDAPPNSFLAVRDCCADVALTTCRISGGISIALFLFSTAVCTYLFCK